MSWKNGAVMTGKARHSWSSNNIYVLLYQKRRDHSGEYFYSRIGIACVYHIFGTAGSLLVEWERTTSFCRSIRATTATKPLRGIACISSGI
ncbi:hypothetical protein OG21DRAFT_723323 [Imleria badia]|nr:hypothetical protein OG21DRAFT_723323 [Imleria badia]